MKGCCFTMFNVRTLQPIRRREFQVLCRTDVYDTVDKSLEKAGYCRKTFASCKLVLFLNDIKSIHEINIRELAFVVNFAVLN